MRSGDNRIWHGTVNIVHGPAPGGGTRGKSKPLLGRRADEVGHGLMGPYRNSIQTLQAVQRVVQPVLKALQAGMGRTPADMSMPARNIVALFSVFALAVVLGDWSGASPVRMPERPVLQGEERTRVPQELTGSEIGSPRSLQPPVYAESEADTLANLLPGGETTFSPLSVAIWRDYLAADYVTALPEPGSAYVKSVSGDGLGGFRVSFTIDGRESHSHLPAHLFSADIFRGRALDNRLVPYSLWSWTDSFDADPDEPGATNKTDGSSYYDYFDINGWQAGGAVVGNFRGFMTYGARTRSENLPLGSATYVGRLEAEVWSADNWQWGSRTSVHGAIHLEADFSAGKISGRIDALRVKVRGSRAFQALAEGNSIDIASGPIGEAQAVAEWIGTGTNENSGAHEAIRGFTGTLIGEFYGPSADEIGGVLSGRLAATATTPEQYFIGSFGSSRPDSGK